MSLFNAAPMRAHPGHPQPISTSNERAFGLEGDVVRDHVGTN
jgi:hypothetical protein